MHGAPAGQLWPTAQQSEKFTGHAAGKGCVDPWVRTGVQTG